MFVPMLRERVSTVRVGTQVLSLAHHQSVRLLDTCAPSCNLPRRVRLCTAFSPGVSRGWLVCGCIWVPCRLCARKPHIAALTHQFMHAPGPAVGCT
jgi:hypothetical protein